MEPFIHPSKRYRLFFDETGHGDLHAAKKDQNQRYLSLTGLAIRQDQQRWSRLTGQNGGLAKVDSGFDYAANFSSFACVA